jgi:hypothetical protein
MGRQPYSIKVEGIPATLAERISAMHAHAILNSGIQSPGISAESTNLPKKDTKGSLHRHETEKPKAPDRR